MQQRHGPNLLVVYQPRQDRSSAFRYGHNSHQLGQSHAMQIKHEGEKLPRGLFRGRIGMRVKRTDQFLEPVQGLRVLSVPCGHRYPRPTPNIGECTVSIVLPLPNVHVHTAWQARIEAPHRAHDVDAFEILGCVLLEDWGASNRVFIRFRRPKTVAWRAVPRRRRIGMIVGDLAAATTM
jgi:hypothetical protein